MVCEKCETKLKRVVTADVWKHQGRTSDKAGTSAGRKINENKALSSRHDPLQANKFRKCRICQSKIHQEGYYCQNCSYKKGICGNQTYNINT